MRVLLPIVGFVLFGLGTAHARTEWYTLVKTLEKSVVTIERNDAGTSCTGFIRG